MTEDEAKREIARQDMLAYQEDAMERLRAQVDLAKMLIQSLILANGGAIVALFTLMGAQGDQLAIDPGHLRSAFQWFVTGLVAALACGFCGFASQYLFHLVSGIQAWIQQGKAMGVPYEREFMGMFTWGNRLVLIAMGLSAGSLIFFAIGAWAALSGALHTSVTAVAPA